MRLGMTGLIALAVSFVGAPAVEGQPRWQLVEDLRIGGEDSEMTMFTDIRGIVAGPLGHIFVLDARPQEIRVFDRAGRFVRLAARRGQGPGEIANANGMVVHNDTIWVNDPSNGRWSAYSAADGKYLRQMTIPIRSYGFLWEAGVDLQGRVLDPMLITSDRVDPATKRPIMEPRIRRVRLDGTVVDTIPAAVCDQRSPPARTSFTGSTPGVGNRFISIPFLPRTLSVLDGRSGYWCSPNDEYLLAHRSVPSGDTLHVVRQRYARIPVSREQRDSAVASARKALAEYRNVDADYSLIPSVQPVFQRLDVDDQGRLWARRVTADRVPVTDVYDGTGRQVATVTTTLGFSSYVPLRIQGDFVYGVVRDQDDVPYVVRARIIRGAR